MRFLRPVRAWLLAALAATAACDDAVRPDPIVLLQIAPSPSVTLQEGDTLTLSASVEDSRGERVRGLAPTWKSSAPTVADVSPAGLVTGLRAGRATVTATLGGVRDSVAIDVVPLQVGSGCVADPTPWAVGEARPLAPDAAGVVCVPGAETGAGYVLVLANTASAGTLSLRASASGADPSRSAGPASSPSLSLASSGATEPDWSAEAEIRARERAVLAARVPSARALAASRDAGPRLSIAAGVPAVGSLMRLNASMEACSSPEERVGRVMAVTEKAIVVADTTNPAGGFSAAEYRHIGVTIDTLVAPVVEAAFGEPTDIDSNGRTVIFYTRAVNEMTERDSDSYVGGFFYARDLFPATAVDGLEGCEGSNFGEIMYLLAPDPAGEVNGNARAKDFVEQVTVGTLAHEFQHLISASRRLYVLGADDVSEEVWLNEGLSHVAEELLFYRASGLAPGGNLNLAFVRGSARVRDAFNRYGIANFGRLGDYLRDPSRNSPYGSDDDLATRGAAWSFLRFAADRRGGDQGALWYALVNSSLTGVANLRAALGTDPYALARDWTVSVYGDDFSLPLAAAYSQPSWDFRSIYPAFSSSAGRYPLETRTLSDAPTSLGIRAGGGAFFPFSVAAGSRAAVTILAGGAPPPATLQIVALRTR